MYARDHRYIASQNLRGNWGTSILVALIASILGGAVSSASFSLDIDMETVQNYAPQFLNLAKKVATVSALPGLIQFIIGGVIRLGNCTYLLKQYDGQKGELSDLFSQFHRFADGFLLSLLTDLFIILWSLLLIIPGIVASFSYAMAPFILTENPDMSPREAITASKEMMRGHRWELFCLRLSFIGWVILSAFTLGIGYLFLAPYTAAAEASFYRELSGSGETVGQNQDPDPEQSQTARQADTPWEF